MADPLHGRTLARTVEGWRSLRHRSSRYCGEHEEPRGTRDAGLQNIWRMLNVQALIFVAAVVVMVALLLLA
jgi:hypothetical protein